MTSADAIGTPQAIALGAPVKRAVAWLGCVVLTLTPVTAVVLLGYLMRRLRFAAATELAGAGRHAGTAIPRPTLIFGGERRLGGLRENILWGLRAAGTTLAITLPATGLMAVGWYAGWLNSFARGYEQAAFGPLTSFAGIALFVPLGAVLPLLQARHAMTSDWRIYLDWRGNRSLLLGSAGGLVGVALGHLAALLVFTIANAGLTFAPQVPAFAGLAVSEAAAEGFERRWMFAWAIPFTLLLLWARDRAGRVYARALMHASPAHLHRAERDLCRTFGIEPVAASGTRRLLSTMALITTLALSAAWIALTYVGQFLNYRGAWGWLNPAPLLLPYVG